MNRHCWCLFCLWLCACAAQPPPTPAALPVATTGSGGVWPPDPQSVVPSGARIVDSREADTDGDGVTELLVVYQSLGVGRGLVMRRTGAGGLPYALGGGAPVELFRARWIESRVQDVNGDGKTEVMVLGTGTAPDASTGVGANNAESLNVFQWNGDSYASLLTLSGPQGVAIDDAKHNGVLDFTALQMLFQRSAIIRATHAEWNTPAYRLDSEVLFLLGSPIGAGHPEESALAYYRAWNDGEPDKMFALLTGPQTERTPLSALSDLTRSTAGVVVETLSVVVEDGASAVVSADIRTVERTTKSQQAARHSWRMVIEQGKWRLAERIDVGP